MSKFKGVNELSIESGDMEDLLKKNEYLDIYEYVESVQEKELAKQQQSNPTLPHQKRGKRR